MTTSNPAPELPKPLLHHNADTGDHGPGNSHAETSLTQKTAYTRLRPRDVDGFVTAVEAARPTCEPSDSEMHQEPANSCQSGGNASVTSMSSDGSLDGNTPGKSVCMRSLVP
jgi:hypothetical protein